MVFMCLCLLDPTKSALNHWESSPERAREESGSQLAPGVHLPQPSAEREIPNAAHDLRRISKRKAHRTPCRIGARVPLICPSEGESVIVSFDRFFARQTSAGSMVNL